MPIEPEAIQIENIRACLDLYQRSIIWAMTASAALFLLSWRQFDQVQPRVHLLYTEVNLFAAYFVALALFFLIGGFALSAIRRAELILSKLNLPDEIQRAVFFYPSLATNPNRFYRIGTVLFGPIAVLTAWGIEIYRTWGKLVAANIAMNAILGLGLAAIVILIIYGKIAKRVWHPFGGAA